MTSQSFIDKMAAKPSQMFLIDSLGAVLSAFLLGFVLVQLEYLIGMPKKELYFLALIACGFAVYSFLCYWRTPRNWRLFLKIIASSNLIYCFISIGLVVYHYEKLSDLGLLYFIIEFMILIIIATVEFKVATKK